MKKIIASVLILIVLSACQTDTETSEDVGPNEISETFPPSEYEYSFGTWKTYKNRTYHFSLEYPEQWWIAENKGQGGPPVINIYSAAFDDSFDLPLTVNESHQVSHVSFFPEGMGSTKPSGLMVSLAEIDAPITFDPDSTQSVAFQLNDGEVWGYFLKPDVLPPGWKEEGYIFVQIRVQDIQIKCFNTAGKEKPLDSCNPDGGDRIIKYGAVDKTDQKLINHMLNSLYFTDSKERRRPIAELIRIGDLIPNDTIKSPALIKGIARGVWFYEGRFPVILTDKDHHVLSQSSAVATGNWKTSGLVPFELNLTFTGSEGSGQGYLLFKKSNFPGREEQDRGYVLPIILANK